LNFFLIRDLEN